MKIKSALIRSTFGALALAAMLVASAGCAGIDGQGEAVGEAAEALNAPLLTTSPATVDFGTIAHGTVAYLPVTLTHTGDITAYGISAIPPDPYRVSHSPPTDLDVNASSSVMEISFGSTTVGTFSGTAVVTYHDAAGAPYTLSIPVTGIAN